MNREACVIEPGVEKVLVSVGEDTPPGGGAACCSVMSVRMEVSNPYHLDLQPGEAVDISDGLGRMMLAGSLFLVLPGVLALVGLLVGTWFTVAGVIIGLGLAVLVFRSQNLGQYPIISGRRAMVPLAESWETDLS
ncbi:MAG: hypothetical protein WCG80_09120 [Spirochaetales bacterium]